MSDFTILGLLGPAGSGKDLVADWFVKNKNFVKVSFADPMKRFVLKSFPGMTEVRLWGPSEERNKDFEVDDAWWYEVIGLFGSATEEIVQKVLSHLDLSSRALAYNDLYTWLTNLRRSYPYTISARVILQTLGTEWGRQVDPLLWVRYGHQIAQEHKAYNSFNGVIIPDHRFKNEVAYTQEQGGYVVRLVRLAKEGEQGNVGVVGHQSESELKSISGSDFDLTLLLDEGLDKVEWAVGAMAEDKAWEFKRRANSTVSP